ncbi:hypothetical protein AB0D49_07190 [Streptomyces sp. NPDC048290]|uniref:hypothetical protein n=1 Tax=Streptomyces sp. NPDC048290 TaxID=3155811 RepID=UPI003424F499
MLGVGEPVVAATGKRYCEDVTLAFHNTGGSAVASGTVTFGTHVIGALGVDWATFEAAEPLPAPIRAGARVTKTWTVCVDRFWEGALMLGAHLEHEVTVAYPGAEPVFIPREGERAR